jgi:hypothetical protein
MTTERMEAYCLEIHDQILIGQDVYKIYDISDEAPDQIIFFIVDEEGIRHKIHVDESAKLPVVIDILSAIG